MFCRRTWVDDNDVMFSYLFGFVVVEGGHFGVDVVGLLLNSRKMRLRQVGATTSCISTQNQVEPGWRNHHASLPLKLVSVVFEVQVGHGRAVLPSGYSTKSRLLCGAQQDS
jgi:hypothetical protein